MADYIEDPGDDDEGYFYQAVVSYMQPIKASVGVQALNRDEAVELLNQAYGGQLNFQVHSIDPCPHDVEKHFREVIKN